MLIIYSKLILISRKLDIFDNNDESDNFYLRNKETNSLTTKRVNFRLNYNPYNLKKSIEENYDTKQLKQIKNMALENANGKPLQYSNKFSININSNIDKLSDYEDKKLSKDYFIYIYIKFIINRR